MKIIKLFDRKKNVYECLVDKEDYELLNSFKWGLHRSKNGSIYVRRYAIENGVIKWTFMHRQLFDLKHEQVVDHKNKNGLDNRRCNLRVCLFCQSMLNHKPYKKINSHLPQGVTLIKTKNRTFYKAQISHGPGKPQKYLGCFITLYEAKRAYLESSLVIHGEFSSVYS